MPAMALERGLDLDLSIQEEYNDNIFFTVDEAIEDYITTLSAGLTMYNYTERANADVTARIEQLYYQDLEKLDTSEELDATDQFYSGKVNYRFSPRWQAGLRAGFSRDSRPDRDVATTGLVLGTAQRDKLNYGAETNYYFNENTAATLSYSYEDEEYDADEGEDYDPDEDEDYDPGEQNEFSDMTSDQVGLEFTHNLNRHFANTYLKFYLNSGRYKYDTVDVTIYAGTFGFVRKISELWSLSMSVGTRYQDTEFVDIEVTDSTDDKFGSVWSLGVDYEGEYGQFGLTGSHDIAPSTGLDGTVERTSLTLKMRYRLAEKSGVGLSAGYFINKADAGQLASEDVDEETWRISPHFKLSIIDDLYLIARYTYSQIDNRVDDTRATRNFALLQLAYEWSIW